MRAQDGAYLISLYAFSEEGTGGDTREGAGKVGLQEGCICNPCLLGYLHLGFAGATLRGEINVSTANFASLVAIKRF